MGSCFNVEYKGSRPLSRGKGARRDAIALAGRELSLFDPAISQAAGVSPDWARPELWSGASLAPSGRMVPNGSIEKPRSILGLVQSSAAHSRLSLDIGAWATCSNLNHEVRTPLCTCDYPIDGVVRRPICACAKRSGCPGRRCPAHWTGNWRQAQPWAQRAARIHGPVRSEWRLGAAAMNHQSRWQ
jgi:hypothetical protein